MFKIKSMLGLYSVLLISDYGVLLISASLLGKILALIWYVSLVMPTYSYQVEVHDVGKEMELDLIKQYSQVDYWYTLFIIALPIV